MHDKEISKMVIGQSNTVENLEISIQNIIDLNSERKLIENEHKIILKNSIIFIVTFGSFSNNNTIWAKDTMNKIISLNKNVKHAKNDKSNLDKKLN